MPSREALIAVAGEMLARQLMEEFGGQRIPEMWPGRVTLKERIAYLISKGRTNEQIAESLRCSLQWVRVTRSQLTN